jgi:hypothetical protein
MMARDRTPAVDERSDAVVRGLTSSLIISGAAAGAAGWTVVELQGPSGAVDAEVRNACGHPLHRH